MTRRPALTAISTLALGVLPWLGLGARTQTTAGVEPTTTPTWTPYVGAPKAEWVFGRAPTEFVNLHGGVWNVAFGADRPTSINSATLGFTDRIGQLFFEHTVTFPYWVTAAALSNDGQTALVAGKRSNGNTCIDRLVFSMPGAAELPGRGYTVSRAAKVIVNERDGLAPPTRFLLSIDNLYDSAQRGRDIVTVLKIAVDGNDMHFIAQFYDSLDICEGTLDSFSRELGLLYSTSGDARLPTASGHTMMDLSMGFSCYLHSTLGPTYFIDPTCATRNGYLLLHDGDRSGSIDSATWIAHGEWPYSGFGNADQYLDW